MALVETSIYSLDGKTSLNSYSAGFGGTANMVSEYDTCFQEILNNFESNASKEKNENLI